MSDSERGQPIDQWPARVPEWLASMGLATIASKCGVAMPAPTSPPRYARDIPLPPYAYVPGHGLPHPVNDPRGHSHGHATTPDFLARLPSEPASRRLALAAQLAANPQWLYAFDLFNEGFC
jgi:hypothetical protein